MEGIWKARRHSALGLDGVDDRVDCGYGASLNLTDAFTIETWIQSGALENENVIVSRTTVTNSVGQYELALHTSLGFRIAWDNGGVRQAFSNVFPALSRWYHVVGTWDGTYARIYVDGDLEGKSSDLSAYPPLPLNTPTHIGARISILCWSGFIASVRIYNRALSEAEVKYLYYNPDDPLDTDHLVLWLHPGSIDTDAGVWYDLSSYGNDGTIYGATKVSLVSPEVTVL